MKKTSTLFILLALCSALSAYAEAPNLLTYQGRLKESGQAVTGNRAVEIFLCDDETAGVCYSSGAQPVAVSNGLFRSTFTIPAVANFGAGNWWLMIKVGTDLLSPRERFTSNAYALFASTAAYASNIAAAEGTSGISVSSNLYVTAGSSLSVTGVLGVDGYGVFRSTVQLTGNAGSATNLYFDNAAANSGKVLKAAADGFLYWGTDASGLGVMGAPYRLQMVNTAGDGLVDSLFIQNTGATSITLVAGSSMTVLGDFWTTGAARIDGGLQLASPLGLAGGGTGADLSLTGGANQFVRQNSAGGVFTVSAIGDADVPDTITLANITQVTSRAIGDTTGTLEVGRGGTGATTLTGVLKGNGTAAVSVMTGTANKAARWSDANTIAASALITDDGTNVGIGVAVPDQELTVAGDISQTGVLISSGTGDNYFAGRVGIGTSTPVNQLHLVGAGPVTQTIESQAASTVQLNLLNTDAAWNFIVDSLDSSKLKIAKGGAAKMTLDGTNVGIGITNPGYPLEVSGQINASGGLCIGGNCKGSWPVEAGSQVLQMGAYAVNSSSHISAAAFQIDGSTVLAFKPATNSFMAGQDAGRFTTGAHGTFVGTKAGYNNTTGQENTFVGSNAGSANSIGEANTTLGYFAGYSMSGTNNTMVGRGAGFYTSTAWDNTFIGKNTGLFNQAGSANVVLGSDAGYGDTGGSYSSSTLLGYGAGYNMLTGVGNVLIGYKAGYTIETGTGNIIIGFEKDAPSAGTNSHLNIGGAIFGDLISGKIGIGTNSPDSTLEVSGNVKLARYHVEAANTGKILTSDDFGKTFTVNSAGPQTITLPAVTASDIGAQVTAVKLGAGTVTIDAPAGNFIADSTDGGTIFNDTAETYATITLRLVTADRWTIVGGNGSWTTN